MKKSIALIFLICSITTFSLYNQSLKKKKKTVESFRNYSFTCVNIMVWWRNLLGLIYLESNTFGNNFSAALMVDTLNCSVVFLGKWTTFILLLEIRPSINIFKQSLWYRKSAAITAFSVSMR